MRRPSPLLKSPSVDSESSDPSAPFHHHALPPMYAHHYHHHQQQQQHKMQQQQPFQVQHLQLGPLLKSQAVVGVRRSLARDKAMLQYR